MPHIGFYSKEISFKVVYCGPGLSGKTTNLAVIHRYLAPERRGDLVMLNTAEERTLFFDYFPLELGKVLGYAVRFNMYTVPGQIFYEASRRLVLDGADGVVFVADSQPSRVEDNLDSFRRMRENLESFGVSLSGFPLVIQYNKRDCPAPIPTGLLEREFRLNGVPVFEAVAVDGKGVVETVRRVTQLIVERFQI